MVLAACKGEVVPRQQGQPVAVDYRPAATVDYGQAYKSDDASDGLGAEVPVVSQADVGGQGASEVASLADGGGVGKDETTGTKDPGPPPHDLGQEASACIDKDGDGRGVGCALGNDCDDTNPNFAAVCPDCNAKHYPGCPCAPAGQTESCYEGDPGLLGKGQCKPGTRTCDSGWWGPCVGQGLPEPEVCDGLDNDCDGQTDEGVLNACGTCEKICELAGEGPGTDKPFSPTPDNSSPGVVLSPEGWLTLSESSVNLHFIWIANSGEGTVSRLDTKTGCEVARYKVCSDPSRTAVDKDGNGIITCRGDGRVAKISPWEKTCVDRNGNGVIDTSRDLDGSCTISPAEMVTNDECVLWNVQPDGSTVARAAGVDKENNPWVGFWNSKRARKLSSLDGSTLATFDLPVRPYGLAIDRKGIIWFASRDPCHIARLDPSTGATASWAVPSGCAYGVTVDAFDYPWVAGWDGANAFYRFDPASNTWSTFDAYPGAPRGLAASVIRDATGKVIGGKVYGGHCSYGDNSNRKISVIDIKTLQVESPIDMGFSGCPVGVAIDSDGNLWAVNNGTSNATKIDTAKKTVIGTYPVGKNPYTYSDMTGAFFHKDIVPEGYYRIVYEGPAFDEYTAEWYDVWWDEVRVEFSAPGGSSIGFRARTANSLAELEVAPWSPVQGPFPPATFPYKLDKALGQGAVGPRYMELEVILYSANDQKPLVKKVVVKYGAKLKDS